MKVEMDEWRGTRFIRGSVRAVPADDVGVPHGPFVVRACVPAPDKTDFPLTLTRDGKHTSVNTRVCCECAIDERGQILATMATNTRIVQRKTMHDRRHKTDETGTEQGAGGWVES